MAVVALCDPGGRARPSDPHVSALIRAWDPEIVRSARRKAKLRGVLADANDFAQEARVRLARIAHSHHAAPGYVRTTIANAVTAAALREAARGVLEPIDTEAEVFATEAAQPDTYAIDAVAAWIRTLPARLQSVYRLLYCEECSQSEAAKILGVSQPRVAQLHQALLAQGRLRFEQIAVAA